MFMNGFLEYLGFFSLDSFVRLGSLFGFVSLAIARGLGVYSIIALLIQRCYLIILFFINLVTPFHISPIFTEPCHRTLRGSKMAKKLKKGAVNSWLFHALNIFSSQS